tara:strand:+ start:876 stop:1874 length:999 start_codon:yes stop_codon:yes gene_type:complete
MKIGFFGIKKKEEEIFYKKNFKGAIFSKGDLSVGNAGKFKDLEIVCVFYHSDIDKEVLDKLPKLKFIATRSTGFNHIDLNECKKRKIRVSNVPHYGKNTVAEHTFALLLALVRKVPEAIKRTKGGDFSIVGLRGSDLEGKTLGVVGTGSIGQRVARIGVGFGMNVLGCSKEEDKKIAKKIGFKESSFNEILRKSDFISFHVPLNDETRHMINLKSLKKIKKGVYLINTSRGEVIDNTALLAGLKKEIIAGAALDVLEGEGDLTGDSDLLLKEDATKENLKIVIEDRSLIDMNNVIITPHIAFYTNGAVQRIMDTSVENIKRFVKGKMINKVI